MTDSVMSVVGGDLCVIEFHLLFIAMHKEKENARIACLDFSLQKAKLQLGILVVVTDPEKLEAIRQRYVV